MKNKTTLKGAANAAPSSEDNIAFWEKERATMIDCFEQLGVYDDAKSIVEMLVALVDRFDREKERTQMNNSRLALALKRISEELHGWPDKSAAELRVIAKELGDI